MRTAAYPTRPWLRSRLPGTMLPARRKRDQRRLATVRHNITNNGPPGTGILNMPSFFLVTPPFAVRNVIPTSYNINISDAVDGSNCYAVNEGLKKKKVKKPMEAEAAGSQLGRAIAEVNKQHTA